MAKMEGLIFFNVLKSIIYAEFNLQMQQNSD